MNATVKPSEPTAASLQELIALLTREQQQSLSVDVGARQIRQSDVAIIGLGGRYPQADNHYVFWEQLKNGDNVITEVPKNRWDHSQYYAEPGDHASTSPKTRCKFGAFLNNYDCFDASFFNLKPEEVQFMDPQERLALETTWTCIEDAGYTPDNLTAKVGVFSGVTYGEFQKLIPYSGHASLLTNRIAYFFNFDGPAVTTDAGCCSSLAAIDLACQSLHAGNCDVALVVGANLIIHPDHYTSLSSLLSSTAEPVSNPFGTDNGWIPAEGVVSIMIKPVAQAIKDRDHIYAVIKSSHQTQDGKTAWFGCFNPKGQARLIQRNFEKSGIHPETISYVEAAANGSSMGDAIEIEGLNTAFKHFTQKKNFCPIGTVKSNIGHGESVSTLLQLTKLLLQFRLKKIFPVFNLKERNPNLRMKNSPFYFTPEQHWETPGVTLNGKQFRLPRRATISSFGAGGNLGHLILEEADGPAINSSRLDSYFVPLSAPSVEQLEQQVGNLVKFLAKIGEFDVEHKSRYSPLNIMFTLCQGRVAFNHRVVFIAQGVDELAELFDCFINGKTAGINANRIIRPGGDTVVDTHENPGEAANIGFVQTLMAKQSWMQLASLWVNGKELDWNSFFDGLACCRVPLPTYLFQSRRFPLPRPVAAGTGPAIDVSAKVDTIDKQPLSSSAGITASQAENACGSGAAAVLKEIFSRSLHIPYDKLDLSIPFSGYGLDSAKILDIVSAIEVYYPSAPKTLFFECRTLLDIVNYLTDLFPEVSRKLQDHTVDPPHIENLNSPPGPESEARFARRTITPDIEYDVAVIGLAGIYPEAENMDAFWDNLKQGKNCITEIPRHRWNWEALSIEEEAIDKIGSKWGGFIKDIDKFDAAFFNIPPVEANAMDPQERLFLQTAWHALEDAGYTPDSINNVSQKMTGGVYVASAYQHYGDHATHQLDQRAALYLSGHSSIANRVSYYLDFKGPSISVNALSAGSLTAVHLACESIRRGECTHALAGGVNLTTHPIKFFGLKMINMIGSREKSLAFGQGDGFLPAEGVGAVLLKSLSRALEDGDHIYGVIKTSHINHGGQTIGYAMPNVEAQASMIEESFRKAGIDPRFVNYVECSANGSLLGDPIEFKGLCKTFKPYMPQKACAIGSVKSNIGHAEAASGVSQLTKVLLQLKHKTLVPTINWNPLNPEIKLEGSPFYLQEDLQSWSQLEIDGHPVPRTAAVTSLGAGGSNAHIVIQEYIATANENEKPPSIPSDFPLLICLSARNRQRLRIYANRLIQYLEVNAEIIDFSHLLNMTYTLQVGRKAMAERLAIVMSGQDAIADPSATVKTLVKKLELYRDENAKSAAANLGSHGIHIGNEENHADVNDAEDKREEMTATSRTSNSTELALLWLRNNRIPWKELYKDLEVKRVSLPVYPFEKERYWLDPVSVASDVRKKGNDVSKYETECEMPDSTEK